MSGKGQCQKTVWMASALLAALIAVFAASASPVRAATLNGHTVVLDGSGKIIPWTDDPSLGYDHVIGLAWEYLLFSVPNDPQNGRPAYYSHSYIDPDTQQMGNWPHNPAGLYSMMTESALKYYAYSGTRAVVDLAEELAEALLGNGMTPDGWNWAKVPYASGDSGSLIYQGAAEGNTSGIGDGRGVIEPDKVGEMGYAWLQLYRFNGNTRFLDAAIAAADALASHVRGGSTTASPWPFRVYAQSGVVREDYCADVLGPISLFDGLIDLGIGDTGAYESARRTAWNWLMAYPLQNAVWANYFEDIALRTDLGNVTQYNALMTARYLLEHPEYDADWESHVRGLIAWVEKTFAVPSYGANSIAEQIAYWLPMGSHTARYASVNALLHERTGDMAAREKAYRSLNWACYMARPNGVVIVGPQINQEWFTDGYGDFIRHFLTGFGAVPEWTPDGQNHLVRSSSIVRDVRYLPRGIAYTTADEHSVEVARVNFVPMNVFVDGDLLEQRSDLVQAGWTYDPRLNIVRVRHDEGTNIEIAQAFSSLTVTPEEVTVPTGTTQQFTAIGQYFDGGSKDITSSAAWSSSDTSVAVIDSAGYCTTVGTGSTTITATLGGVSGSADLFVQAVSDATPPVVTAFVVPSITDTRIIGISIFTATDNIGVTGYYITASSVPPAPGQSGWTATVPANYAVTADGTYTLYPWAKDEAGNVSPLFAAPRTVIVDTIPPDAAISYAPDGPYKAGAVVTITATFDSVMADAPVPQVAISGTDTLAATDMTKRSATVYTYAHTVGTGDGAANVSLSAGTDLAGNIVVAAPTDGGSFTLDNTPPDTSLNSYPADPTNRTDAGFTFTSPDAGASFQCFLDVGDYAPCTSPAAFSGLASGQTHTFQVRAVDAAGNTDETPVSYAWTIYTTVPDAPVVFGTTPTNDTTPTWNWTSAGGNGTYRYKLDDGNMNMGATLTTATSYTPAAVLGQGSHTLFVQEQDDAENWSVIGSFAIVIDTVPPTVSVSGPSLAMANSSESVTYTLTYSGAEMVTLAAEDITLNRTETANGTVGVSGSGTGTRTVTISNITGVNGTLGITIQPGTAGDAAGNLAGGTTPSATFAVDNSSGDFDDDGVDAADALKALRITAGIDVPAGTDIAHGDVAPLVGGERQPDGRIDFADVVAILRKAADLPSW